MGCADPNAVARIGSRDAERVRLGVTVSVRAQSGSHSAIVHDLSLTGARIESKVRFERGEIVQLRLPFLPVEQAGEIVWVAQGQAGVQFYSSLDTSTFRFLARASRKAEPTFLVVDAYAPVPATAPRCSERAEVAIGASCRTTSGRRGFVAMIDLTPEGCCLFGRELTLSPGQKVTLEPECLRGLKATVQWANGSLCGVLFETSLYPAVFEHLASTYPWPLSESAKDALSPRSDLSDAAKHELVAMINRAEKALCDRNSQKDVLTTRPPTIGTRAGLAPQASDRNLSRLFLG